MDTTSISQIILVAVIVLLTFVLVILGFQIFLILKESKETLRKVNKILDGASGVMGSAGLISNPLVKVVLGTAVALLAGKKKNKDKMETKEKRIVIKEAKPKKRFFFRRV